MVKQKTSVDTSPANVSETRLKGLERRTHQGRRNMPRRKSDPKTDAEQAMTEPDHVLSLASEADALVTHCYEELFSLFPELLAPFRTRMQVIGTGTLQRHWGK